MSTKYREFSQLNLPSIEQEILAKWDAEQAFQKSIEVREGATPFVFYEGPPSANGMPGIHHVISRTLKDLVCRYKTMKGFKVNRKGGWDTHGLPIELGVEKELGITKEDIGVKITVEEYNKKCREAVLRYKDKWDEITKKMGYWVDLNDPYITFDNNYIETLWWLLQQLYKKGLLYESVSIQPYSPAAGTGLSSHELNQPGTYKDVKDTSATVMFRATQDEKSKFLHDAVHGAEVFFMAWTTTPWTLPSNLGLTVGPNIDYVLVQTFNPYTHLPVNVVLAKDLVHKYLKAEGENGDFEGYNGEQKLLPWKIITSFKGSQLEGLHYEQLLPYEANSIDEVKRITPDADPFRVLIGDFVTTEDGTGIVHTAPAFGADDYRVGKKYNIGILTMVDREGKFLDGLGEFSNRYVKNYKDEKEYVDVNVDICVKLKKENRAFKVEKYEHSYPHCWRTDKPILYYPLDAWFIKTTAIKDKMVELNKTINWKPKSTGEGRFGNWLENMVDWNLSRSRFWGTALPIWKTEDGEEEICIGTVEELKENAAKADATLGTNNAKYLGNDIDLHKPYVDEIVLISPSGKPMKRVPDLIDVWFDSGAMPYAQWGLDHEKVKKGEKYPFKLPAGVEKFEDLYPASFIAEGVDQTRGWFYTLHAIASLVYDSVAYKTVVSNGLVLDKNGNKMSKRLGNVVNPFETIEKFGADATRWYLITNASPWDNLKFDIEGIKEVQRKFFGTLYNTYQFFALYANVDGFAFKEAAIPVKDRPEIDQWILSSLHTLIKKVTDAMDDYEPTQAGRLIEEFVDEHLSNWYVRLCRRRFWKGEYEQDKISAYQTLYECLETVLRLMAPVSPFFSDAIFTELNKVSGRFNAASIHHVDFPVADESLIDAALEERMQLAQDASSLVLSLRKKVNIKVRQPLQKILIPVLSNGMQEQFGKVEDIIKSEVNVKEIEYLTADNTFIKKKIKPNFIALGKKLGPKMKAVSTALAAFTQEQIAQIERETVYNLLIENETVPLYLTDVEILSEDVPGWMVTNKGAVTVALDVTITPELLNEGNARELVNRIQKIRKESGFELTDRIAVELSFNEALEPSITQFKSYICAEILADSLEMVPELTNGTDIEVNDFNLKVQVLKKGG
ncbi:isoleucyl-tRNA synthetase [Lacibacter cauensis]|uniref:Isoleucine--tRNA ligase n=1 Tax=Lacibacter cauensis TaxID=510947 RepID=A0A562SS27_9BACT|nr:isoleucine--tRNA ligase [Lacibacter cauensis]TWI83600.1 isoleucyl-tRNA synthetase [Lacibacter cauensis]